MRELYEEAGTGFVSCYEVAYSLTVEKNGPTGRAQLPEPGSASGG
jgi:hypothetical protein